MASPAERIIRLGFGFAVSQALRVVADLEIADRLVAGELTVEELAVQTDSHVEALYRIMRLLAAEGVFCEASARRFKLTDLGAALRSDVGSSARELMRAVLACRLSRKCSESHGSTGWPIIRPRLRCFSAR